MVTVSGALDNETLFIWGTCFTGAELGREIPVRIFHLSDVTKPRQQMILTLTFNMYVSMKDFGLLMYKLVHMTIPKITIICSKGLFLNKFFVMLVMVSFDFQVNKI